MKCFLLLSLSFLFLYSEKLKGKFTKIYKSFNEIVFKLKTDNKNIIEKTIKQKLKVFNFLGGKKEILQSYINSNEKKIKYYEQELKNYEMSLKKYKQKVEAYERLMKDYEQEIKENEGYIKNLGETNKEIDEEDIKSFERIIKNIKERIKTLEPTIEKNKRNKRPLSLVINGYKLKVDSLKLKRQAFNFCLKASSKENFLKAVKIHLKSAYEEEISTNEQVIKFLQNGASNRQKILTQEIETNKKIIETLRQVYNQEDLRREKEALNFYLKINNISELEKIIRIYIKVYEQKARVEKKLIKNSKLGLKYLNKKLKNEKKGINFFIEMVKNKEKVIRLSEQRLKALMVKVKSLKKLI